LSKIFAVAEIFLATILCLQLLTSDLGEKGIFAESKTAVKANFEFPWNPPLFTME